LGGYPFQAWKKFDETFIISSSFSTAARNDLDSLIY